MPIDFSHYLSLELETPRLCLRMPTEAMLPAISDYFLRNRLFLEPWTPRARAAFYSEAFQLQKLQQEREQIVQKRLFKLFVFEKTDLKSTLASKSQRAIGQISLSNIVWGGFRSCFLGYSVDATVNGQGIASEALTATRHFAFAQLKLHRLEANIMPRNQASIRVVEKLGFVCEGLSPKYLKINGVWEDHLHYVSRNLELE